MFERFTDRARRVVVLAQEAARESDHCRIEPEHLLISLLREGDGVAWQAITNLIPTSFAIAAKAQQNLLSVPTTGVPMSHIPYSPATKKVLELSMRESLQLGHNYIGTEHILLALIRHEGSAAECITAEGLSLSDLRKEVINILSGYREEMQERHERECGRSVEEVTTILANAMEDLATANKRLMAAAHAISGVADKLK